jgi:hypothetical protein
MNKKLISLIVPAYNEEDCINDSWQRRKCPICGSADIPSRPESSAHKPAEKMSWDEAKSYFIGLRNDQVFFSYFRCDYCDLLYCPWYFTEEQVALLYSEMPDNTMGEDKSTVSKTQSAYAKWILQDGVVGDAYLEVGPDIGLVSKEIVALAAPRRVSFVEPNLLVRSELLDSVKDVESIEVVDFIEDLVNTDFTLIVGVHVYDHLLDPIKDLRNIQTRAGEGANLAIVVHDEKSILRRILKAQWPPFCLQHPQLYNPKTLNILLEKSGWSAGKIEKSTNWYHLRYFIGMGFSVLGSKDRVSRYLPNIEFPIRLGNLICIAKKRN